MKTDTNSVAPEPHDGLGYIADQTAGYLAPVDQEPTPMDTLTTTVDLIPPYVADIVEYASRDLFPMPGHPEVLYTTPDTFAAYRWVGDQYVQLAASTDLSNIQVSGYRLGHGSDYTKAIEGIENAQGDTPTVAAYAENGELVMVETDPLDAQGEVTEVATQDELLQNFGQPRTLTLDQRLEAQRMQRMARIGGRQSGKTNVAQAQLPAFFKEQMSPQQYRQMLITMEIAKLSKRPAPGSRQERQLRAKIAKKLGI